ncbi:MAG TPA: prepilin-type N-terminal cleavage/methylation domain-containing protein [Tepidisphaeraceae bacterium]|jgi:prepilin-type N-terminal cleavage/methylation domain-containing protein|nr:prepilin-type N-terminal cleavage/methylation domain-containing protein [Tepidisphaeraceae bacterium]
MRSKTTQAKGFTIIELLVVITLITILMSILLPGVSKLRNIALGVKCQGNVRSLMGGFLAFAADHDNHLPGADRGVQGGPAQVPYQTDWLMNPQSYQYCPQTGTVYPYINSAKTYLCPAMDTDQNSGGNGNDEYASNGKFDYGFFTIFNGAQIQMIPQKSQMILLSGTTGGWVPTPIICQEDGYQVNGYDQEGNHSNVDQMSHIHNGGSYYASIDGSVNWINEPDVEGYWGDGCWQWQCMGPKSKAMVNLGNAYSYWNSWKDF